MARYGTVFKDRAAACLQAVIATAAMDELQRSASPAERHVGADRDSPSRRHALDQKARQIHTRRWSRHKRNWQPTGAVTLNSERESIATGIINQTKDRTAA